MSLSTRIPYFVTVVLGLVPVPALAGEETPAKLDPVVVTATRLPTPASEVASSVTVVTAEEIKDKQYQSLADALVDVPGLNLVQTGGAGGTAAVFMRGTNSNHTKVLVDGIDVSDPSSTNGAFDFSQIPTEDIEKIEIVRGPQSGLYGADALGGVINVITKKGDGPARFHASLEGGSFGTFNQTAGVRGSEGRFSYAFDMIHDRSTSTPVTPKDLVPVGEKRLDNLSDNRTLSTRLGADLTDTLDVGLVARATQTKLLFTGDDSFSPVSPWGAIPNGAHTSNENNEVFTRGTVHHVAFDGLLDHTFGVAYTNYRRRATDLTAPNGDYAYYRGDRIKGDWQGDVHLSQGETLTLGAETQRDSIDDSGTVAGGTNSASADMTNTAGFVQLQSDWDKRVENALSVRYDDNSRFAGKTTFREAPALLIPETGTKLKASLGSGYKAPSLDQLFHTYNYGGGFLSLANPDLRPEKSLGFDGGFEQEAGPVRMGATYFRNDIQDLIQSTQVPGTSNYTYTNVSKADTQGVENFVAWDPLRSLSLRADYTYTLAEDAGLHQSLLRRPKHKGTMSATWKATEDLTLTATAILTGNWVDFSRDGTNSRAKGSGYTTANLSGSYTLTENFTVFGRVTNLLDRKIENPVGFLQPGIGVFGGVKLSY